MTSASSLRMILATWALPNKSRLSKVKKQQVSQPAASWKAVLNDDECFTTGDDPSNSDEALTDEISNSGPAPQKQVIRHKKPQPAASWKAVTRGGRTTSKPANHSSSDSEQEYDPDTCCKSSLSQSSLGLTSLSLCCQRCYRPHG